MGPKLLFVLGIVAGARRPGGRLGRAGRSAAARSRIASLRADARHAMPYFAPPREMLARAVIPIANAGEVLQP